MMDIMLRNLNSMKLDEDEIPNAPNVFEIFTSQPIPRLIWIRMGGYTNLQLGSLLSMKFC